jgi:predicted nucleic acid-binding protein
MWMIDTLVIINWMKKRQSPIRMLEPFFRAGRLVSCGVIRVEVLRGMTEPETKMEFETFFDLIPEVPLTSALWKHVSDVAWSLDRKGEVLALPDLIIAVSAIQAKAELVTQDAHFLKIPGLRTCRDLPGINTLATGH